jgi:hypothetical protein
MEFLLRGSFNEECLRSIPKVDFEGKQEITRIASKVFFGYEDMWFGINSKI